MGYEPQACLYSVTFNRTYLFEHSSLSPNVSHICHVTHSSCSHHPAHRHPPHWPPKAGWSVTHVMGDFEAVGERRIWVGGLCG